MPGEGTKKICMGEENERRRNGKMNQEISKKKKKKNTTSSHIPKFTHKTHVGNTQMSTLVFMYLK